MCPDFPGTFGNPATFRPRGTLQEEASLGHQRAPGGPQRPQSRVMAAARVQLLLSGRPESVSFARSVCGLLGAGPGLGPWPIHCGLKRGRLVLSSRPFPGASARLPLQVSGKGPQSGGGGSEGPKTGTEIGWELAARTPPPTRGVAPFLKVTPTQCRPTSEALTQLASFCQRPPFCPFAALDGRPRVPGAELPTDRGVDLGVAVILQSSDKTVLLTRRARTLSVSPNLWVPPGEYSGDEAPRTEICPFPATVFSPVSKG